MNLSLKQLQYFSQFYKYKNVSTAATKLGVTQPALTASLRKIEHDLDIQLFHRSSGHLMLNDNGYLLAPQIDRLLSGYAHVTESAENISKNLEVVQCHVCIPYTPWTSSLRSVLMSDKRFKLRTPDREYSLKRVYDATIVFHFSSSFAKPGFMVREIMKINGMCLAMTANSQQFKPENKHCELFVPAESLVVGIRQILRSQVADQVGLGAKIVHQIDRYDQIIASAQSPQAIALLPGPASGWAKQYGTLLAFTDIEDFANFELIVSLVTPLDVDPTFISEFEEIVRAQMLVN